MCNWSFFCVFYHFHAATGNDDKCCSVIRVPPHQLTKWVVFSGKLHHCSSLKVHEMSTTFSLKLMINTNLLSPQPLNSSYSVLKGESSANYVFIVSLMCAYLVNAIILTWLQCNIHKILFFSFICLILDFSVFCSFRNFRPFFLREHKGVAASRRSQTMWWCWMLTMMVSDCKTMVLTWYSKIHCSKVCSQ